MSKFLIKYQELMKQDMKLVNVNVDQNEGQNEDKCRCECKQLIDKGICGKEFIWNPSNCECECDESCDIGEYLDFSNCKCRKTLIDKFAEECTENIDEVKTDNENEHKKEFSSCTVYIVLFSIILLISIGIGTYFVYSHWYLKKDNSHAMLDTRTETTIYGIYKWEKLKKLELNQHTIILKRWLISKIFTQTY